MFLDNIKFNVTFFTSTKVVDEEEFLVITKVAVAYTTTRLGCFYSFSFFFFLLKKRFLCRNHYRFENLLNNNEISDSINNILNENQDIINNEINEPVSKVLSKVFKYLLNIAFEKYPYRSLFL